MPWWRPVLLVSVVTLFGPWPLPPHSSLLEKLGESQLSEIRLPALLLISPCISKTLTTSLHTGSEGTGSLGEITGGITRWQARRGKERVAFHQGSVSVRFMAGHVFSPLKQLEGLQKDECLVGKFKYIYLWLRGLQHYREAMFSACFTWWDKSFWLSIITLMWLEYTSANIAWS